MKIYPTVDAYLEKAKQNDIIVLGGRGLMDGIKSINSKHDTMKVVKLNNSESPTLRHYRGKTSYEIGANSFDQEVAVLSKKEFANLTILW